MPRANAGNRSSSSGRRGSSRSGAGAPGGKRSGNSSGKEFPRKEKRSPGSFRKSDKTFGRKQAGGTRDAGSKSGSFAKKNENTSRGDGDSSFSRGRAKPYKPYKKTGSSFNRKDGDMPRSGARPRRGDQPGSSSGASGSRSSRTFDKSKKPFQRKDAEGGAPEKRSPRKRIDSGSRRDDPRGARPFRKPGSSRDLETRSEKHSFFKKDRGQSGNEKRNQDESAAPQQTGKIRLNRFIANSGVCSRREADELITMGLISVNGTAITELGYKVNPGDEVRYENRILRAEKPVYILLNKPKGYLTTTDDPQERNTVMQIIGDAVKERIYPVGRLDRNTTGLLLLTNDGDLADKLMHPSYDVKKIYKVELDRPLTKTDFQTILDGVRLEEGKALVDDLAIVSEDGKTVGLEIHIGWNRVVRRIFESLNYQVLKLDRTVYAGLDKKDLPRGHWRFLTREELVRLKHFK